VNTGTGGVNTENGGLNTENGGVSTDTEVWIREMEVWIRDMEVLIRKMGVWIRVWIQEGCPKRRAVDSRRRRWAKRSKATTIEVWKDQQVTHTHTDKEQHPRHTHPDKNNTRNFQTNTLLEHLTKLEGGATTVRPWRCEYGTWRCEYGCEYRRAWVCPSHRSLYIIRMHVCVCACVRV